jgi:hypothetical protein
MTDTEQTLTLANKFFPAIYASEKNTVILKGRHDIHLGCLRLEAADRGFRLDIDVEVWKVLWKRFADLTVEEIQADGGTYHESFLEEMRKTYPEMDWQDDVTVVEWVR